MTDQIEAMTNLEIAQSVETIYAELGADGYPVNHDALTLALTQRVESPILRGLGHLVLASIATFTDEYGEAACSYAQITRRATCLIKMFRLIEQVGPLRLMDALRGEAYEH